MRWCHREPTLDEILSDPIFTAMMDADGVNAQELEAMLREGAAFSRAVRDATNNQTHFSHDVARPLVPRLRQAASTPPQPTEAVWRP
jgi:hypothetical protein